MRVTITHSTRFRYSSPAWASFSELRLTPRNDERQNLLAFSLTTTPRARATSYRDHFGTQVHAFNVAAAHTELVIVGNSRVLTSPRPVLTGGALVALEDPGLRDAQAEWLHPSALAAGGDHLLAFAQHVRRTVRPASVAELVAGVSGEVHRRFQYSPGTSYVSSTVDDLLERGTGVCQDFAHLAIAALRDLGVPARYVSGYFYAGSADPEPDVALAVESHAWIEALVPGVGWLAYDPTNDCPADERHVTVAVGRDYADVAPVRGVLQGGAGQRMDVSVSMVAPSQPFPDAPLDPRIAGAVRRHRPARDRPGSAGTAAGPPAGTPAGAGAVAGAGVVAPGGAGAPAAPDLRSQQGPDVSGQQQQQQ